MFILLTEISYEMIRGYQKQTIKYLVFGMTIFILTSFAFIRQPDDTRDSQVRQTAATKIQSILTELLTREILGEQPLTSEYTQHMVRWQKYKYYDRQYGANSEVTKHSALSIISYFPKATKTEIVIMLTIPDSNFYGAHMGPTWVLSAPAGPHVDPMNLAIRDVTSGTGGCRGLFLWGYG